MSVRASVLGLSALLLLPPASAWAADAPSGLAKARDRGVRVLQPGEAAAGELKPAALVVNTGVGDGSRPFIVSPATHAMVKPCDRPFSQVDLALGTKRFDFSLSTALKAGRPVVVDVIQPYDPTGPAPPSLAPWLSAAKSGGGAVIVSPYCTAGRGVFTHWLSDVVAQLTGSVYRPARDYDVTLYADALRRQITQVRFQPKSHPLASD